MWCLICQYVIGEILQLLMKVVRIMTFLLIGGILGYWWNKWRQKLDTYDEAWGDLDDDW